MARAFVLLGSNQGDRERNLGLALDALSRLPETRVVRASSAHETAPVGGPPGQRDHLDQAVELETSLDPEGLLRAAQGIEAALGRVRAERWGPRTIDVDILLYGERVVRSDDLEVPHPRLHERRFALAPLAEIAPDARHPVLGRTVRDLLERAPG